jgi:membrane-bound metal-dependent hydrolase YbcI (DUF457 family)
MQRRSKIAVRDGDELNRPSHITYGVCLAVGLVATTGGTLNVAGVEAYTMLAAPFAIVGSYLPDIDVKNSNMRKRWKSLSKLAAFLATPVFVLLLLELFGVFSLGFFGSMITVLLPIIGGIYINLLIAIQLKHRTYTHSWYMPAFFGFAMWAIATHLDGFIAIQLNSLILGVGVGFTSHLISDSFTKSGTYLAYPIPFKIRFLPKFMAVSTGKRSESVFTFIFVSLTIAYCAFQFIGG